jgi:pimeloyl-ACP methyl ester carboxylesterase
MTPETRYAKSGAVNIAYQVAGEGPLDLVLVPGWVSHVELAWTEPSFAAFLRRLASFSRLILIDRRGTGLSDRVSDMPTLEERMDDVRAVMDAAGSRQAALFGISEGGPMCVLFAATYPERTSALILYGTIVRGRRAPDYPWGLSDDAVELILDDIEGGWGTGLTPNLFAPSLAGDPERVRAWAQFERMAVSPGGARTLIQMLLDTDVRDVLPAVRVPTLVLHRTDDRATLVEGGRYLAAHIAGARYVELPGEDHFAWVGDSGAILDEVEEFLTGARQPRDVDRILATLLFVDIVGSTERAAELGDRRWRELLERFYATIRAQLRLFRGVEVNTTGDGFLARFDGPARAIRCAGAVRAAVRPLGIDVRSGLHTGECELIGDDIGGISVHLGARVAGCAAPGQILVSGTVKDLVAGSGLAFADAGAHQLKGIPGEWRLFSLV